VQKKHAPFLPTTWPGKQRGANGRSGSGNVLFVAKKCRLENANIGKDIKTAK